MDVSGRAQSVLGGDSIAAVGGGDDVVGGAGRVAGGGGGDVGDGAGACDGGGGIDGCEYWRSGYWSEWGLSRLWQPQARNIVAAFLNGCLPVVVTVVNEVCEAPTGDVLVLVTDAVIVLVEAGRVVVVVVAAVSTLVLVFTTSIKSPQVTAVGYTVGEQVT